MDAPLFSSPRGTALGDVPPVTADVPTILLHKATSKDEGEADGVYDRKKAQDLLNELDEFLLTFDSTKTNRENSVPKKQDDNSRKKEKGPRREMDVPSGGDGKRRTSAPPVYRKREASSVSSSDSFSNSSEIDSDPGKFNAKRRRGRRSTAHREVNHSSSDSDSKARRDARHRRNDEDSNSKRGRKHREKSKVEGRIKRADKEKVSEEYRLQNQRHLSGPSGVRGDGSSSSPQRPSKPHNVPLLMGQQRRPHGGVAPQFGRLGGSPTPHSGGFGPAAVAGDGYAPPIANIAQPIAAASPYGAYRSPPMSPYGFVSPSYKGRPPSPYVPAGRANAPLMPFAGANVYVPSDRPMQPPGFTRCAQYPFPQRAVGAAPTRAPPPRGVHEPPMWRPMAALTSPRGFSQPVRPGPLTGYLQSWGPPRVNPSTRPKGGPFSVPGVYNHAAQPPLRTATRPPRPTFLPSSRMPPYPAQQY